MIMKKSQEIKIQKIVLNNEIKTLKIKTFFKLFDIIFEILVGITKNAPINIIQNIFKLKAIKIDNINRKK